jgi:putative N6-adenine-specific DNA methylase
MSPSERSTLRHELFASSAPGLEPVTLKELQKLGFSEARAVPGGCVFHGTLHDAARANFWLRTATRVLLRLGAFDAPGRRELVARARRLDLSPFVRPGTPVKLHVTASRSRLYHTGLIAEAFHEATGTTEAAKDAPAPEIFIRFQSDRCTLSIDTSGELLYKRGYRQEVSRAPLRETLAAGMLLLSGYDGELPFLDPMCGSGTITIEAFLIATRTAPGAKRTFAWQEIPSADAGWLDTLRAEAASQIRPLPSTLLGSDIHAGALASARRNAERAGADAITWERLDAAKRQPPAERGLIVTNPPYGKRVGHDADRSADEAMHALSSLLSGPFRAWNAGVLAPQHALRVPGRKIKETRLDNGGIPVTFTQLEPLDG